MSGFSNPIVNAAGTLIRTLMKSANYVAGSLGWQITKDGNAEFNNGIFRGPLRITGSNGSQIVIDAGAGYPTQYFYSIDGTNYSQFSLINYASNSAADFWISSGQWTPPDGVFRATRLYMAGAQSNIVYLAVARVSDGAVYGGTVEMNGTFGSIGFRTPANVTNLYNRLSFDANGAQLVIAGILEIFNTATIQFDGGTTLRMKQGASLRREGGTSTAGDVGKGVVNYSITNGASINTTAGAPFSAKILVGSIAGFVVEADRAYAVQIIGGFQSNTPACSPNFYLHTGIASGAGAILWDWLWGDQAQGDVRSAPSGLGYFRRVGGGGNIDISLQMLTNGSGAGNHYADANHKRGFIVYDVGIANDFPWATNV